MEEGNRLKKRIERRQDELAPEQVSFADQTAQDIRTSEPRADVPDEQFPTDQLHAPRTEEDRLWTAKQQLVGPDGITPFGMLEARDSDFKRLLEREALVEEANMQAWFAKWFDHASPAQKKRARELWPNFYAQRAKLLSRQVNSLERLAKVKLFGIESPEDLFTIYLAETGRLDIEPLKHILNPESGSIPMQQRKFQRGLGNPSTYIFGNEAVGAPGQAQTAVRQQQTDAFATRAYPASASTLGMATGFPPTGSSDQQQGTRQWWQILRQAVSPAAPATGGPQ